MGGTVRPVELSEKQEGKSPRTPTQTVLLCIPSSLLPGIPEFVDLPRHMELLKWESGSLAIQMNPVTS